MRRGDIRTREIPGVGTRDLVYLGKGRFSTAWELREGRSRRVYLWTVEGDYSKEIAVSVSGRSTHLPRCKYLGDTPERGGEYSRIYEMPFYSPLTAAAGDPWRHYRALAAITDQAARWASERAPWPASVHQGYAMIGRVVELAGKDRTIPRALVNAIALLRDASANYGSQWWLELAPRNLGVHRGRLILRDCVFDRERLAREHAELISRRHYGRI